MDQFNLQASLDYSSVMFQGLHTPSRSCHSLQEAFQGGAGWREALLLVHLWPQQEAAFLRWSPQNQSPRPVPAPLCPRERRHSLAVWL